MISSSLESRNPNQIMLRDIKIHYKEKGHVIVDVDPWKYSYNNLKNVIESRFFVGREGREDGVETKYEICYYNGYIMVEIVSKQTLRVALMSSLRELVLWVEDRSNGGGKGRKQEVDFDLTLQDMSKEVGKRRKKDVDFDLTIDDSYIDSGSNVLLGLSTFEIGNGSGGEFTSIKEKNVDECDEIFDFTSDDVDYESEEDVVDDSESEYSNENVDVGDFSTRYEDGDGLSDVDGNLEGMVVDSDDENMKFQTTKIKKCRVGHEFEYPPDGKLKLQKGMLFDDVYHFRRIVKDYIIQEGFDVKRIKNEKARVTFGCKCEGCPWRLHASPCPDGVTYKIKTLVPEHACVMQSQFREVTDTWIAKKLEDQFKVDPNKTITSIAGDLRNNFKIVGLSRTKLFRARKKARTAIEGDHTLYFAKLPGYADLVLCNNPGSSVKLAFYDRTNLNDPPVFKRMFFMLGAVKEGFLRGCRPFIGVDGCFLKGPYEGMLLVAVALDGNNGIVPLACSVVESECKDSWLFFMFALKDAIGEGNHGTPWTFMSDRQKGLIEAVNIIFPHPYQRFCCRHIEANLRVRFKGGRQKYLWRAAKESTKSGFECHMLHLSKESEECHDWLSAIPHHLWSRHRFDTRCKVDHVTNNMTESFNKWINDHRHLPYLSLFEEIRLKIMKRFGDRYEKACSWDGVLCPKIRLLVNENIQRGRSISVIHAGRKKFQVMGDDNLYVVDLEGKSCSCGEWDVSGIPCKHGTACITSIREDVTTYVSCYYTVENYRKIYSDIVPPQPGIKVYKGA